VTIGIGAFGPRAGLAVYQALRVAERVGRGAIGGFATYAAITADGRLLRAETQRGGGSTLFTDGETTGVEPPEEVASAIAAGVISSGPDRPAPLTQFLPSDGAAGLVTGHRLPNAKNAGGQPINEEILALLRSGRTAREAVDAVLDRNANSDTGIIAVDRSGQVYSRNTARVLRRPDLGHARREHGSPKAVVEVLHNAIRPYPVVAALAADVALATMVGEPKEIGRVMVSAGCPVALGPEDAVLVDDDLNATKVVTTDPLLVSGRQVCAAIYLHSKVVKGGRVIGRTMFEPITTVVDGRITEMSGQKTLRISFQADTERAAAGAA
jgi:uncharacterized protein DUF6963